MIERPVGQRASDSWNFQIQVCRLLIHVACPNLNQLTFVYIADSASSAVRNLNDYEIMNRKLRVDFSNDGGDDDTVSFVF